jgi:hypothetical protein
MPLGFGLAASHAGFMYAPLEKWPIRYEVLTRHVPQPPQAALEDAAVLAEQKRRIAAAMDALSRALEAYQPDAVVIVGDDQNEIFTPRFTPSFAIYTGDTVNGTISMRTIGESLADNRVEFPCRPRAAATRSARRCGACWPTGPSAWRSLAPAACRTTPGGRAPAGSTSPSTAGCWDGWRGATASS